MSLSDGIVQARFTPGGKIYHYHCPEARIGDHIRSEGMYSTSAEVIGFGRTNGYTGYCRPAKVVPRYNYMQINFTDELCERVAAGQQAHIPIYKENPAMSDFPPFNRPEDRIKEMERALKQEREHHKAARKAAAAKKAALKERARLRKVALKTLEAVATQGHGEARVRAAVELLEHA